GADTGRGRNATRRARPLDRGDREVGLAVARARAVELAIEPGARQRPVALHGDGRHSEGFRRLLDREPGEVAKLDHTRLPLAALGQRYERLIEIVEGDRLGLGRDRGGVGGEKGYAT